MQTETLSPEKVGFDPACFSELAEAEAASFWFKARNQLILWALEKYAPQTRSFLEIGCGTGFVLSAVSDRFPDWEIYGTELFAEGLSYAAERLPTANLIELDAKNIPFEQQFDAIGTFDVLEHIDDDRLVLEQIFKALAPGGTLFITVPQHAILWSPSDDVAHHFRRYERADLVSKVRKAGFSVIRTTSFVSTLMPLMLASRLWQRYVTRRGSIMSELQIKGFVGAVLECVLTVELFFIKRGWTWPAGGTLFLVARKLSGT